MFAATRGHRAVVLVVALALLATASCGYHFPGEGTLPGGATSIHVAKFENRTRDAGLENYLLEAIQTEIARRGKFTLAEDRGAAQLTLEGTIVSIERRPVAFSSSDEALQYQTYVTIGAVLRDTRDNKAVWRISALREGDSYGATSNTVVTDSPEFLTGSTLNSKDVAQLSDVQLSESQEREALDRVFQNTSRDLYNAMVENF
jgi:outer membrane lipopolysaccharide assembly protein LptE/RlpB